MSRGPKVRTRDEAEAQEWMERAQRILKERDDCKMKPADFARHLAGELRKAHREGTDGVRHAIRDALGIDDLIDHEVHTAIDIDRETRD